MDTTVGSRSTTYTTLFLCFSIALFEGFDLQSMGVTAARIAQQYSLNFVEMGWAFTASSIGLLPGAAIGGRASDLLGRKNVLMLSVALFGIGSIATAHIWDFHSLLAARFFTGLGIGAAMPNLISLCAEAVGAERRNSAVSFMYSGLPVGAAVAAAIGVLSPSDSGWVDVFYIGGLCPILLIPVIAWGMNESAHFIAAKATDPATSRASSAVSFALWGEGRAVTTIAIWGSFLCTITVFYFLLNWLPSFMLKLGVSRVDASAAQVFYNVGGAIGAVCIGRLMDSRYRTWAVLATFGCAAFFLWSLTTMRTAALVFVGTFLVGMLMNAAQSLLYSVTSTKYPVRVRGTGVGAAVSVGRVGAIVGPLVAGQLLALGLSPVQIVLASIPLMVVAAFSSLFATLKPDARN
ncbi:3-(3-hydroxy-phenyl)propionate transporter MhpT [Cupriavidus pinatubonensis]|uniref:3-(3-hydroxy-phenyl)propionate transporter MhpT n=1 Tax=Cupriavidus pinatubonensis TaxID=248026 RepID=UPI001C739ACA|nr:3-(3-hydroxy-phenyl)propionate transporter MhpT [Cupriavidus pinatubonensis]QYY30873.1 3-(3-hydroxy-phenyl)propionate transporter MhpT [Cupriavidus pinatubonensis]